MFYKINSSINSRFKNLAHDKKEEFLNAILIILFDGEENVKLKMHELQQRCNTQDEIAIEFQKIFNFNFYAELIKIIPLNNLSDIILAIDNLKSHKDKLASKITNPDTLIASFDKEKEIAKLIFKTFFNINIEGITNEDLSDKLKYDVYFSKQNIADEFGIDRKTLNNWLNMAYGFDPYICRRKLSIIEYKDIFERLFIANDEGTINISENLKIYENRIIKGVYYSKLDIIELTNSNHKTIMPNLSKINKSYYEKYDKFPYSIAKSMLKDLGTDIKI